MEVVVCSAGVASVVGAAVAPVLGGSLGNGQTKVTAAGAAGGCGMGRGGAVGEEKEGVWRGVGAGAEGEGGGKGEIAWVMGVRVV